MLKYNITGFVYLDMLQKFIEHIFLGVALLSTDIFQQDEAPRHYAKTIRACLNERTLGSQVLRSKGAT
jgi:hypothetical protein